MIRQHTLWLISALFLCLPLFLQAAEIDDPEARARLDLNESILSLRRQATAEIANLEQTRTGMGAMDRLDLDRRITAIKKQTEIDILQAQLHFATTTGRQEMARRLAEIIAVRVDPNERVAAQAAAHPTAPPAKSEEAKGGEK